MASEVKVDPDSKDDYNDDPEFTLSVKGLDYTSISIRARKSDTVTIIKQKYANQTGKPVETQRLIWRGNELKDDEALQYYGINGDAIVHIAFKRTESNPSVNNQPIHNQHNQSIFGNIFGGGNQNDIDVIDDEKLNLLSNPNNNNPDRIQQQQQQQLHALPAAMNVDRRLFSIFTCITAYSIVCCIVPIISIPDIVTLIIVNDYDFNYNKDSKTRQCVETRGNSVNVSMFLNIGAALAILIYLAFALWLFWFLKVSNFIVRHRVPPEQLNLSGFTGVLASTKTMNYIWWILNFGLLCIAAYGIGIYENSMTSQCRTAEIGILLIVWSIIHLLFSFCICCPLCCSCLFGMNSNNVFVHQ